MSMILSLIFSLSYGLSLVQESKNIECKNSEISVFVDKRDRFIEVTNLSDSSVQKYTAYEFLDSAILLKKTNSEDFAFIQLTPKNTSILILGGKHAFTESNCQDTGGSKTCAVNDKPLFWSPTQLSYSESYKGRSLTNMNVRHYGVYPNDGTYFLSTSPNKTGLGVIDYGSKLDLVYGKTNTLDCVYLD